MLTINPSLKIVATILAKNESDIIGQMIEHHLCHGVSKIIFTDNNSTDDTRKIAEKYPEVIEIIDEPDDTHNQSKHVTKMARLACKLNPDWIIHLDADEFWGGLSNLRMIDSDIVSCETMYLHPPVEHFSISNMRYYLDFDHLPIPQEAKIAHRPDPNIEITHGNHGVVGRDGLYTRKIFRHHYPIRTLEQWERKAKGHLCLNKRNSSCARWENWYNSISLRNDYNKITSLWKSFIEHQDSESFMSLMKFWAAQDMMSLFENSNMLPKIGEWPKENNEKQSCID
jgi:glycosyltransferase involved in cell wall biosynthesis